MFSNIQDTFPINQTQHADTNRHILETFSRIYLVNVTLSYTKVES